MKFTDKKILSSFKHEANFRMVESEERIGVCLQKLNEKQIWQAPNKSSNSIGNLILHLNGNISQWILSSLGEVEDDRDRDKEFSVKNTLNKQELFKLISNTITKANEVIDQFDSKEVLISKSVQGFDSNFIGIVLHVVEHLSYHTGQIALLTKEFKNQDLKFYEKIDLNKKNLK